MSVFGQFQFRRDTAANWTANNTLLLSGEIGVETDTKKWKMGDGITAWNSLAYLVGPLTNLTNDLQTKAAIVPNTVPSSGQIHVGNAGGTAFGAVSVSGDATLASTGALSVTKTGGAAFGGAATLSVGTTAGTVASGNDSRIVNAVPNTTTVNGHALSSNVTVTTTDLSLNNVTNDVQTKASVVPNTVPSSGQIHVGNVGGTAFAAVSVSGDATLVSTGALSVTKTGGVAFGGAATLNVGTTTGTVAAGDDSRIVNAVPTSRTVNGHALSSNVTVTTTDLALNNVTNDVQTKAAIVPNTVPAAGQIHVGNAGGTAFAVASVGGDATLSSTGSLSVTKTGGTVFGGAATLNVGTTSGTVAAGNDARIVAAVPNTVTVNGHALNANVTVTASDVSLGSVTNDVQTKAAIVPNTVPTAGQIHVGNAGNTAFAAVSVSGDATLASTGVLSVTKTGGVAFGSAATLNTGSTSATLATGDRGLPTGGTINQTLQKNSSTNYDVSWVTDSGGAPSPVGTDKQIAFNSLGSEVGDANLTWDTGNTFLNIGQATQLTGNPVGVAGNVNNFLQINNQNKNSGTAASADIVVTSDNGSDSIGYFDLGINSSTYNQVAYNVTGVGDGYLIMQGGTPTGGGNLVLGTASAGMTVKVFTGGTTSTNLRLTVSDTVVNTASGVALQQNGTAVVLATRTVAGHALSADVVVSASDLTTGTLPHAQLPTLLSGDIPANAANTSGTAANLSGTPTLPNGTLATTQSQSDNSTKLATTAYVDTGLGGKAATSQAMFIGTTSVAINRGSGTLALAGITSIDGTAANLSGTPALPNGVTATTQALNDATAKLATDAFVLGQVATTTPVMNGSAAVGTGTTFARADHVHPSDTARAAIAQTMNIGTTAVAINRASGALVMTGITSIDGTATNLSGTPALPNGVTATTQTAGDNSTKLATTAYVNIANKTGTADIVAASSALSTTETVVIKTVAFPASRLAVGTHIRLVLIGTCTSTAANMSTFTVRWGTNGTTADGTVAVMATSVAATTGTTIPFRAVIDLTIRTNGASGTAIAALTLENTGITGISAVNTQVVMGTMTALNTTTANGILSVAYKSAATTTTSTFQIATIEMLVL